MSTRVVNIRKEACDVYIGRAGRGQDGYFGNPFRIRVYGDRAHLSGVMAEYKDYFLHRVETDSEFRRRVLDLRGKRLGCFCKPGPCHGDVIVEWLSEQQSEVQP